LRIWINNNRVGDLVREINGLLVVVGSDSLQLDRSPGAKQIDDQARRGLAVDLSHVQLYRLEIIGLSLECSAAQKTEN
jgi:hypothetical protein